MKTNMRLLAVVFGVAAVGLMLSTVHAEDSKPIKHKFYAMDESRSKLHFVDESDASKNWDANFPARYRDCQLIGGGKILVSTNNGYAELDLATHKVLTELKDANFSGTMSVRRLANGHTIIGCQQKGIAFYEVDAKGMQAGAAKFPTLNTLRLFRLSSRGTLLFGANTNKVIEADMKGNIIRQITLEGAKHIYQVLEKPDGNLLVSSGYGMAVMELDKDGKVVKTLGGKTPPPGVSLHFFAGMQVLKNGNIVVCNWAGHGANDNAKTDQLLEFSPDGKLVWKWHDIKIGGSLVGIMVMDDLDPSVLNDDSSSVLGPVK